MRVPVSTYRLQLNEEFTLADAREVVPYLSRLGITDLYLSPVFETQPGSTHGYDVTDPTRIREALGGADAFDSLAAAARRHGMGILLDIVPNHMAASPHNPWWRDVLQHGRDSAYARFFDIDWGAPDAPRRMELPILGEELAVLIERGDIRIDAGAGELAYFDTRLPLAPGTFEAAGRAGDAVRQVMEAQHYELVHWQTAARRMSYRRFFDITELAGVRVEDDDVFDATHSLIRELAGDGRITGLRIDHIDGLRDPAAYLRRLRQRVRGPGGEPVYTVVEKILEHDERIPDDWSCEGTTGYEFLNMATGMLLHPDGVRSLSDFYRRITGDDQPFAELVRGKKLLVMERLFGSELNSLGRGFSALTGLDAAVSRRVVEQVSASMDVYRTYIRSRRVRAADRQRIEAALSDVSRREPALADALVAFRGVVLDGEADADAALDWVMRWQQFTGPVMAKGFEDTALYCHNALLAANEVGSNPVRPYLEPAELHALLDERQQRSPRSLNATATHDTKRGEDTRARIAVLSEVESEWRPRLRRWMRQGDEWKHDVVEDDDVAVPEADVDSLLYQTIVGAWPLGGADDDFTARLKAYMTKAVKEAKQQTSWRRPDEDFEQALTDFIDILMAQVGRQGLAEDLAAFGDRIAPAGALNALAQTLLRLTAPGIPDTYQGTELWSLTLVDPDNRHRVDFRARSSLLEGMADLLAAPSPDGVRDLLVNWRDGRIKLLLLALALHCRIRNADLFDRGRHTPLSVGGTLREHAVAFARESDTAACIVVLPRWMARLDAGMLATGAAVWDDTHVALSDSVAGHTAWRNALTGETVRVAAGTTVAAGEATGRPVLALAEVFAAVPFAVLEPV